jgi:nucleotide-binding universal stress UspA family protein
MKLIEKILVPVDVATDNSEQINAAIKLASAYNSEIILLYVVPDDDLQNTLKDIVLKAAKNSLNEIREILVAGNVNVGEPKIAFGKIVATIIDTANSETVNVILIGSKSKPRKSNYKLGVTAEQIIRMSDVPVFLVKPETKKLFTNILCPVDFSEPSARALHNAIKLAGKFDSTLTVCTVYEPLAYVSPRLKIDLEEENASRLKRVENELESFIRDFDLDGIKHKIEIKTGKIEEKILEAINELNIDLLIMGTNGRTGISWFLLGSITERVIREMPCSVITIKKLDVIRLKLDYEIKEIEEHYKIGEELISNAFYEKAIEQFKICLQVNDMHIPSINKLAGIYEKLGNAEKSFYYNNMATEILMKTWDKKIEEEIRRHYRFE